MTDSDKSFLDFLLPAKIRVDTFLAQKYSDTLSRASVQKFIENGSLTIDGVVITKSSFKSLEPVKGTLTYKKEPEYILTAKKNSDYNIIIVYQDNDIAIIHKPAGITVHPGAGTSDDTLVHHLLAEIDNLSDGTEALRPGIVHRLDRYTEGLLVIAKNNNAHRKLALQFKERTVYKEYHAWVKGMTIKDECKISGYIDRNPNKRKLMIFAKEPTSDKAKSADLIYQAVKTNKDFSLLKIQLLTGRTHQIRATLSFLNKSVVADFDYNFQMNLSWHNKTRSIISHNPLMLVSNCLQFNHPQTQEKMSFSIELPKRFNDFSDSLSDLYVY